MFTADWLVCSFMNVQLQAFFCLANVKELLQAIADTQESGKVLKLLQCLYI